MTTFTHSNIIFSFASCPDCYNPVYPNGDLIPYFTLIESPEHNTKITQKYYINSVNNYDTIQPMFIIDDYGISWDNDCCQHGQVYTIYKAWNDEIHNYLIAE